MKGSALATACLLLLSCAQLWATPPACDTAFCSFPDSLVCASASVMSPDSVYPTNGVFSSPSAGLALDSLGNIDPMASLPGLHEVQYIALDSCADTFSLFIQILPTGNAVFTYLDTLLCENTPLNPTPIILGDSGGAFSASAGLIIDSLNGEIDLSLSVPGAYQISYSVDSLCPDSATFALTILARGNASFSFADSSFCTDQNNPFPIISGDSGGVFFGSLGLGFDSLDGEIKLGLSPPGLYWIGYTVDSLCPDSAFYTLSLSARKDASFAYLDTNYCSHEVDPLPFLFGDVGGRFNGSQGLVIDSLSGEINLSQSISGQFGVSYRNLGTCGDTSSVPLNITAAQNPLFSYNSPYCISDPQNPVPVVSTPGGTFSVSGSGLVFADLQTGEIDLLLSQAGSYQILYTTPGPCADSLWAVMVITAQASASFHYPDTSYCDGSGLAAPVVLGQGGGWFSCGDSLLSLDSLTGFVNLSASDTGTFAVQYVSPGTCTDTSAFALSIKAQGKAQFDYIPDQFCISDPNPLPVITGDSSGVFSVLAGGGAVDPLTGEIDLANSVAGDSVLIQYRVSGYGLDCPDSALRWIEIFEPDTSVSINYPKSAYCPDETNPLPNVSGTSGGSFQAQPPGLSIGQFTGEIDLSQSQAGTYLVRYFPPGACTDTTNGFSLTLHPVDVVSLNYPQSEYCSNEGVTSPLGLADSLGSFTEASGFLVFDPVSGEIDLDSSQSAAYLIRYESGGACPVETFLSLSIHPSPEALLISNAEAMTICEGEATDFIGFGGDTYAFSVNDSSIKPLSFDNLFQPDFFLEDGAKIGLEVKNNIGGCVDRDSLQIRVRPVPGFSLLDYDSTLTGEEAFELTIQTDTDSVNVDWWFESLGEISLEQDSGSSPLLRFGAVWQPAYAFELANNFEVGALRYFLRPHSGGCMGEVVVLEVLILPLETVFIPAVLTPNEDGFNDVWEIRHKPDVAAENWTIEVFNRSGGKVYAQSGLAPVWTGDGLPDGVYWYVATDGSSGRKLNGGVTIRRK